jgi:hypothetical protein
MSAAAARVRSGDTVAMAAAIAYIRFWSYRDVRKVED